MSIKYRQNIGKNDVVLYYRIKLPKLMLSEGICVRNKGVFINGSGFLDMFINRGNHRTALATAASVDLDVVDIQNRLLELAHNQGKKVDLVTSGQKGNGVDGKWGEKTAQAFQDLLLPNAPGLMNDHIKTQALQKMLGQKNTDGVFGPQTARAFLNLNEEQRAAVLTQVQPPIKPTEAKGMAASIVNDVPAGSKGEIVIDPGHGGLMPNGVHDPGAIGIYKGKQVTEAEANWLLSQDIAKHLTALGYTPRLTKDGINSDETARTKDGSARLMAERGTSVDPKARAFLTVHQNSLDHNINPGPQVFYNKTAREVDQVTASVLSEKMQAGAPQHPYNIAVLNPALHAAGCTCPSCRKLPEGISLSQPALLIEASNMKNHHSIATVMDPDQRDKLAQRIANAIDATMESPTVQNAMVKKADPAMASAQQRKTGPGIGMRV